jgi:LysR family transcriptional regulator, low CO2-responsive transcriptional regulator
MNISFRQMRVFLALADTGSVGGAARAMHVTQPTASMQLREVSLAVGLPLYEVVSRRVHLTEAGIELARTARAMVAEWESFAQRAAALRGLQRGRLQLAVVSTAEYFMPRLLGAFCEQHPGIDVALQILNRDGVVERLRQNLDDLYIMSMPPADIDLDDAVFMPNPLQVVAARGHPLATRGALSWRELRDQQFVLRERGSGTRMAIEAHFRALRLAPRVRMELGSNEAIKQAVAGGLGLGIVSVHALDRADALVALPVEGFPIESRWHVVSPRGKRLSPAALAFRERLLDASQPATPRPQRTRRPATAPGQGSST